MFQLNKTQFNLLFHIGFLCLLPLLGHSLFGMGKQLIEYFNYGYFHTECMQYILPYFTNQDFDICKSDDILQLGFSFAITSAVFVFMGNSVRKQIVKILHPKEVMVK